MLLKSEFMELEKKMSGQGDVACLSLWPPARPVLLAWLPCMSLLSRSLGLWEASGRVVACCCCYCYHLHCKHHSHARGIGRAEGTEGRVVCSSLELSPLDMQPSCTITWLWSAAGYPRWRVVHFLDWVSPRDFRGRPFCCWSPCWCLWSMLLPEAELRSMVGAAFGDCATHLCCRWGPGWCPWSLLRLETTWNPMICAAAGCCEHGSLFCSVIDDCRLITENERHKASVSTPLLNKQKQKTRTDTHTHHTHTQNKTKKQSRQEAIEETP